MGADPGDIEMTDFSLERYAKLLWPAGVAAAIMAGKEEYMNAAHAIGLVAAVTATDEYSARRLYIAEVKRFLAEAEFPA